MSQALFLRDGVASVLVVYVNPAVGAALAQRLMDSAAVSLAAPAWAADVLATGWGRAYDIVLLCPYLARAEREAVLAGCGRLASPPEVLELADEVVPPGAHVRAVALPCAPERPLSSRAHAILGALRLGAREAAPA